MSRSPLQAVDTGQAPEYQESFLALRHMLRRGSGWSGGERNCVFLNTGNTGNTHNTFADVSATSGYDFADDGRGLAVTDWDFDGDLDFWASNRTGPRLRFMRNENDRHGDGRPNFVAFRLTGTRSNRDAVGARLELYVTGREQPLIRTVRAGEGFLSQSSEWLHFGLSASDTPRRLLVRWPAAAQAHIQEFQNVTPGQFYDIVEGQATLEAWRIPNRQLALSTAGRPAPKPSSAARVFLASPVPAPELEFEVFTEPDSPGQRRTLESYGTGPKLVNLWASWCAPCVKELREFSHRAEDIRKAGIEVIALSLDGVGEVSAGSRAEAEALIQRLDFPFPVAMGNTKVLDQVELLHGALLYPLRPFPIPTSLLIDAQGWVVAIYQGPVSVETLLADAERTTDPSTERRNAAVPFVGRWLHPPGFFAYWNDMGLDYMDSGYPEFAAVHYRKLIESQQPVRPVWRARYGLALNALGRFAEAETQLRQALEAAPGRTEIYDALSLSLLARNKVAEAVTLLRQALSKHEVDAVLANRLAWLLATHPDDHISAPQEALKLAEQVCKSTDFREARYLDTLAAAQARLGHFGQAAETAHRAMGLSSRQLTEADRMALQQRLNLYKSQKAFVLGGGQ